VLLASAVPTTSIVVPCSFVARLYVVPLTVIGEPPSLKVELPKTNCVAEFAVNIVPSSVTTTGAGALWLEDDVIEIVDDPTTMAPPLEARKAGDPPITVVVPSASVEVVPPIVITLPATRVWLPMINAPELCGKAVIVFEPTVKTTGGAAGLAAWGSVDGIAIVTVPPKTACVPEGSRTIGVPLRTVVCPLRSVDVVPPMMIEEPGVRVWVPITMTESGIERSGSWGFKVFGDWGVGIRVMICPRSPGILGASVMTGGEEMAEGLPGGCSLSFVGSEFVFVFVSWGGGVRTIVVEESSGGGDGGCGLPSPVWDTGGLSCDAGWLGCCGLEMVGLGW
jgi:hypothetical protein